MEKTIQNLLNSGSGKCPFSPHFLGTGFDERPIAGKAGERGGSPRQRAHTYIVGEPELIHKLQEPFGNFAPPRLLHMPTLHGVDIVGVWLALS